MSENPEKGVKIYRNETDNYSFVCFHCGDITDTAERILAHVEDHFNLGKITEDLAAYTIEFSDCDEDAGRQLSPHPM